MFGVSKDIWNGYSSKEKLYVACKKTGMLKIAQFINRKVLRNKPAEVKIEKVISNKIVVDEWQRLKDVFDKAKKQFYGDIPTNKRKIVFSGHVLEFDKGICSYINTLQNQLENAEVLLISHATMQAFSKSNLLIQAKYYTLPYTFGINRYNKHVSVNVPEEIIEKIREKEYLVITEERIRQRHKDMGSGYPMALTWYLYNYYCEFLDYYKPDTVILWCEFYCGHNILKDICEERDIKVIYMEFGALPGTVALEESGQMGESDVATKWEEFLGKSVSDEEIGNGEKILKYLKETGLNRRTQIKTNVIEDFRKKYIPGRPTVVMFGQNDYEAGIKPYTENSRKYHSPIFEGSDDAALFVEKLAIKNNWNYIYKPHQMMVRVGECLENSFSSSVTWVGDSDINELIDIADVVITIVSQCGYVSLIRDKATVMLGYTQLRGKGCTYEAFNKNEIENIIKLAIENGYTEEQKEAFRKHTAQLLKYYLFDDGLEKKFIIGQGRKESIAYVINNFEEKNLCVTVEDKQVAFVCRTELDIQGAINIRNEFADGITADLYILNSKTIFGQDIIEKSALWNSIINVSHADIVGEFIAEKQYSNLFVAQYDIDEMLIFNEMKKSSSNINVHLFDGGNLKLFTRDIARDSGQEMYIDFFNHLVNIYLYDIDFMVWNDKMNIRVFKMPRGNMNYIEEYVKKCNRKVYFNSFMQNVGYNSNEMDMVNYVLTEKSESTVIPFCNASEMLLKNNGYIVATDSNVDAANNSKIIFSSLFNGMLFYAESFEENCYIDLSRLIVSGYPLLSSNSYKKFMQIYEMKAKQIKNYFIPASYNELNYILEVFSRKK